MMKNEKNISDNYSAIQELFDLETSLKEYNFFVSCMLSKYFKKNSNILDFGAGIGTIAEYVKNIINEKPICVELDSSLRNYLKMRGFSSFKSIMSAGSNFDGVYTSNVLEHIDDDIGALRDIKLALKKDGILSIYVPAYMCLYSDVDRFAGHYRRYAKKELLEKLVLAGYDIVECQYCDSLGFFVSLAVKVFGFKSGVLQLGSRKSLVFYDKYIFPVSRFFDKIGLKFFFGKNLFVVAKKIKFLVIAILCFYFN
jgi:ubiquinone/menaquinone biosynthesis C-methylase UbiE